MQQNLSVNRHWYNSVIDSFVETHLRIDINDPSQVQDGEKMLNLLRNRNLTSLKELEFCSIHPMNGISHELKTFNKKESFINCLRSKRMESEAAPLIRVSHIG